MASSCDSGSLTLKLKAARAGCSSPKKTKTFLPTLATDSPHGWSSQASGSPNAKSRSWSRRLRLTEAAYGWQAGMQPSVRYHQGPRQGAATHQGPDDKVSRLGVDGRYAAC